MRHVLGRGKHILACTAFQFKRYLFAEVTEALEAFSIDWPFHFDARLRIQRHLAVRAVHLHDHTVQRNGVLGPFLSWFDTTDKEDYKYPWRAFVSQFFALLGIFEPEVSSTCRAVRQSEKGLSVH